MSTMQFLRRAALPPPPNQTVVVHIANQLVPSGGFRSNMGEIAACVLEQSKAIVNVARAMGSCRAYSHGAKDGCDVGLVATAIADVQSCCFVKSIDLGSPSVMQCQSTISLHLVTQLKKLSVEFGRCTASPSLCSSDRAEFRDCLQHFFIGNHFQGTKCQAAIMPIVTAYSSAMMAASKLYTWSGDKRGAADTSAAAKAMIAKCVGNSGPTFAAAETCIEGIVNVIKSQPKNDFPSFSPTPSFLFQYKLKSTQSPTAAPTVLTNTTSTPTARPTLLPTPPPTSTPTKMPILTTVPPTPAPTPKGALDGY
jgi:hypothetical protein